MINKRLNLYLVELLGVKKARELRGALKLNTPIFISGTYGSGKSTLARALRKCGYNAIEDVEMYHLTLVKKLDHMEPNKLDLIFSEQENSEKC